MHTPSTLTLLTLPLLALAAPAALSPDTNLTPRASCPPIHIFAARETTAPPGYGSTQSVVNKILAAHSGATSESIVYPACGGGSACGGYSYSQSVAQGTTAVINAVSAFAKSCPSSQIVLVGYSQGSEIIDTVLCEYQRAVASTTAWS